VIPPQHRAGITFGPGITTLNPIDYRDFR